MPAAVAMAHGRPTGRPAVRPATPASAPRHRCRRRYRRPRRAASCPSRGGCAAVPRDGRAGPRPMTATPRTAAGSRARPGPRATPRRSARTAGSTTASARPAGPAPAVSAGCAGAGAARAAARALQRRPRPSCDFGGQWLGVDHIADAAHRADEARADLAAQIGHVHIQRIAVVAGAAAQRVFLQGLTRQHPPVALEQQGQQVKLAARQLDRLAMQADLACALVQGQAPQAQALGLTRQAAAPGQRAHPAQQLGQRKGLDQIVVRPVVQAAQPVFERIARAQHQHRQLARPPAHLAHQRQPIPVGQPEVQQHHVEGFVLQLLDGLCQPAHPNHVDALVVQRHAHAVAHVQIIFDQQ
mmetsp:Transcript_31895/g.74855  ORF Transcript_31895/g.74855 Transcript_31895/m.74855 type:complete len:356 (-) Transcript_31895:1164-2231(-)